MSSWILPAGIWSTWTFWVVAAATQKTAEDARQGVPRGLRRGTSALPIIPLCPLAFWGLAIRVDYGAAPWGTVAVGAAHAVFAAALAVSIARDWRDIRLIDRGG